ncbi:MAG: class II aldolase/adducin family protein [Deltaproteobacteria bacterium]|nr:MAG: class II aldolase/adducin family protein [Deltaproteobacteria bacterium]
MSDVGWSEVERALRRELVEAGRVLAAAELNAGFSGNMTARLPDVEVLVTPSGRAKGDLRPDDIIRVRADGERVGPGHGAVSSELAMHLAIYAAVPDVQAIVHAHPVTASAVALVEERVNLCITAEAAALLGPTVRVPYVRPGTAALGEACAAAALLGPTLLLEHHGAVTTGHDVRDATARMETLEHVCRVWAAARALGAAHPLPDEESRALRALFGYDAALPVEVFRAGEE